ncbi:MBL fold metallo-hydrolase [Aeromicrobium sp. CF4.19]|uniref:MBL fold metallo-hydrolase n=1 Tax=Aeromicrobium sp. CF4.19 TaxID=3373082 RepID=UPI003EE499EB
MRLTVVGCSGSFPGPESASSCYLLEHEGYHLLLDLGSGALGPLQRHVDLRDIDAVGLSHLHADHCFDLTGFFVVSKYHPDGALPGIPILAPDGAEPFLSSAYGRSEGVEMSNQFRFRDWVEGEPTTLGPFTVTATLVDHPVTAYAFRIEAGGSVIAYSGDTGPIDVLVDVAAGADLFLCEASFVESKQNPPNLHLTGAEAGEYATRAGVGRLLVTHIPSWTDVAEVEADLKTTYAGPYDIVRAGDVYEL